MKGSEKWGGRYSDEEKPELRGDHYEKNDLPGTDSYDDGLNEKGRVVMPGSTSTESGGNYMEHRGPNDLVYRAGQEADALGELDPEVRITDSPDSSIEEDENEADRWMREHGHSWEGDEAA